MSSMWVNYNDHGDKTGYPVGIVRVDWDVWDKLYPIFKEKGYYYQCSYPATVGEKVVKVECDIRIITFLEKWGYLHDH